jgi:hypothetical protein
VSRSADARAREAAQTRERGAVGPPIVRLDC